MGGAGGRDGDGRLQPQAVEALYSLEAAEVSEHLCKSLEVCTHSRREHCVAVSVWMLFQQY